MCKHNEERLPRRDIRHCEIYKHKMRVHGTSVLSGERHGRHAVRHFFACDQKTCTAYKQRIAFVTLRDTDFFQAVAVAEAERQAMEQQLAEMRGRLRRYVEAGEIPLTVRSLDAAVKGLERLKTQLQAQLLS